jgi:DNA polymerase-3 subunit delta'
MNLGGAADIKKVTSRTHFAILGLPRGYGTAEIRTLLTTKNTVFFEPTIHDKQKSEIINVDDIAEIERVARTKQKSSLGVVILHAEKMNEQAQNKFLKLLEEPGDNIHFVFVTENVGVFMPTVLSRAQVYHIPKISREQSAALIQSTNPNLDQRAVQQIMFLASGLPGEIKRLASDPKYLAEQAEMVNTAKTIVTGKPYDIIKVAQGLKDDRERAMRIIDLAVIISKELVRKSSGFLRKLEQLERARQGLEQNANVRLCLVGNLLDV